MGNEQKAIINALYLAGPLADPLAARGEGDGDCLRASPAIDEALLKQHHINNTP
jgi:hypothetical protein